MSACGASVALMVGPPPKTARSPALATDEAVSARALSHDRLWCRGAWLLWSFSLVLFLTPIALLSPMFCEKVYFWLVYRAICYSRSAALTKWSQWASVRLDLLPAALCGFLSRLQASAPVHSFAHTLAELQDAGLLARPSALPCADAPRLGVVRLDGLSEVPCASGSIAQVHTAYCGGRRVAVKVRHPSVHEDMLSDFELLRIAAVAVHDWIPALRWMNAPATVSQFEAAMSGQCDLSQEARHFEAFRANFIRKAAWVVMPEVIFATPAVLVESFEHGQLGSEFVRMGTSVPRSEAHFVITRGEDVYLQMLLADNLMHADLHPGNLLYRREGPAGAPQLVILDAGMAAYLTAAERKNFIGLLQAIGDGSGQAVAERILDFSRATCAHPEAFKADVNALCAERCRGYGTGLDIGLVIREMMQLMYRHNVPIDGNYATLIANMLCLEGMASSLEPRFNVLDVAYPLLRAHQALGDERFHRCFRWANWLLPACGWDLFYRFGLYAALNGDRLKRYQI